VDTSSAFSCSVTFVLENPRAVDNSVPSDVSVVSDVSDGTIALV